MLGKLVLITNRKSYMSSRLVPKSVSLDDLERRNWLLLCVILPNSAAFVRHLSHLLMRACCGNMTSNISQANAVGRRFVALSLILLYLCSLCNRMDFLNVKCETLNVGPNLTNVGACKDSTKWMPCHKRLRP